MVSVPIPANEVHVSAFLDMAASSNHATTFEIERLHSFGDGDLTTPSSRSLQSLIGIKRLRDSGLDDSYASYEGVCDIPKSYDTAERDRMRPRFITRLDFSPSTNDSMSTAAPENVEMAEVQELGIMMIPVHTLAMGVNALSLLTVDHEMCSGCVPSTYEGATSTARSCYL
jgi:hypothetical protein